MKKSFAAVGLCVLSLAFIGGLDFVSSAVAETIWTDRNSYNSTGLYRTGDVIVVNVEDISDFRFDLKTESGKNVSVESSPDITITGFLPTVMGTKKIKGDDSGKFDGGTRIGFSIAAVLGNRLPDGRFAIAGSKAYSFNGAANTINITGSVDPATLKNRVVASAYVANLQIQITSRKTPANLQYNPPQQAGQNQQGDGAGGATGAGTTPAAAELTDAQKRQLLMEYINDLINEQRRQ